MASLAEIRAKLLAQEKGNQRQGTGDNAIYPFWNIPENSTATIRFLPDGNEKNDFFWLERQMIRIPFTGVKGHDEGKAVTVTVPCVEMWGTECPIHKEIRPWFKDTTMEDMARKYWKKRSYLFQGFVVDSPFDEDSTPENAIRRFIINPSIYKIISAALMDPDFGDYLPTDYDNGTDFRITKTQKGQYADYTTSNWARKERSLNQTERDVIAEHGLFDLNDFMPKKPSDDELQIIFQMFEASVEGELYDPERFADHYRPYGLDMPNTGSTTKSEAAPAVTPKVETQAPAPAAADSDDDSTPAKEPVVEEASGGTKDAKDILAAIRARKEAG
jgi:hypothetical protein